MNAHALLTSQGWRGTGHSLHPTSDTKGLSKPLLVSKKANNLGVGKKQHNTSDMWWLNAFDKSLKGLDTSKEGTVVQTLTNGSLDMVVKGGGKFIGNGGGLYASFVRGEVLGGTLTLEESVEEIPEKKRRKLEGNRQTKEERRARKAAKRAKPAQEAAMEEDLQGGKFAEMVVQMGAKEERTERRRQKKLQKEADRNDSDNYSEKAKKKKKRRKE